MLFHAILYTEFARLSITEIGRKTMNQRAQWLCYSEVVREINRRFDKSSTRCSDENILAVVALAFHGEVTEADNELPRWPSQGPLDTLQGLNVSGGRLDTVEVHLDGLLKMLSIRGGIDRIEFPGLAAMLS